MSELKYLCIGESTGNRMAELLEIAGATIDRIPLDDYLEHNQQEYAGMLFMPGYFDWDSKVNDKEAILRKVKKFVDNGNSLYTEYIECPDYLFVHNTFKIKQNYPPRPVGLERFLVRKDHFVTKDFSELAILPVRNCTFLPGHTKDLDVLASFAVVRGVHQAEYELPHEWEMFPALCAGHGFREIFATFELSKYRELEFPLAGQWEKLIRQIVLYLLPETVRENAEKKFAAIPLPMTWTTAGKFPASKRQQRYRAALDNLMQWYDKSGVLVNSDGSAGAMEGFRSFDHRKLPIIRSDCNLQIALLMELYGRLSGNERYKKISSNLVEHLWKNGFQDRNPKHNTYGLWKFYQDYEDFPVQVFCNDNSWGATALSELFALTGNRKYLESAGLTAENIRRWRVLEQTFCFLGKMLNEDGEKYAEGILANSEVMNPFVPAMYAVYGHFSGNSDFIRRAEEFAENYVDHPTSAQTNVFPILMYAILFQLTAKSVYETEIRRRVERFEKLKTNCGGVRNILYNETKARNYYGILEVDVTHKPTDEIVDILYVNGPFVISVYTAWKATGDKYYLDFFHDVMDFLCAVQLTCPNTKLRGAWMRGYDYRYNDYNGANGDMDWGPFCVESGWCNAWIGQALAMYLMDMDILLI